MLVVGMVVWVVCYVLFVFGDVGSGFLLLVIGIVLYGICYDFFFVIGQIYIDVYVGFIVCSSVQGFIILVIYGVGMLIGIFLFGVVVEYFIIVVGLDWQQIWLFFVGVVLVVLIVFLLLFCDCLVVVVVLFIF